MLFVPRSPPLSRCFICNTRLSGPSPEPPALPGRGASPYPRTRSLPDSGGQTPSTLPAPHRRHRPPSPYWASPICPWPQKKSLPDSLSSSSPRRVRRESPWLLPSAATTLLESARHPVQARLCYFGLYAGCRVSESAAMSPDNAHDDRLSFVGKGQKKREVPLHPELAHQLRS
jgi:hypothetical protein